MQELISKVGGLVIGAAIILIVALSWFFVNNSKNQINKVGDMASKLDSTIESSYYDGYNKKIVTGTQVLDCIDKSEHIFPQKVQVRVLTTRNAGGSTYGWKKDAAVTNAVDAFEAYTELDPSDPSYINPNANFTSKIEDTDKDGMIDIITFTQKQ